MERTRPQQQLTDDETEKVLKRAAELGRPSRDAPIDSGAGLGLDELEKVGLASGMTREQIQRAYLELRAGKLNEKPEPTFTERFFGPEGIAEERAVALTPESAGARVEAELKQELLHPEELDGDRITWAPAPGMWAAIQRGINWQGQQGWRHATVVSQVSDVSSDEGAKSLVRIEANLAGRMNAFWVASGVSLFPAFVTYAVATQGMPGMGVAFAGLTAVTGAGIFAGMRSSRNRRLRALRLGITRVLDRITGRGRRDL